MRPIYKPTLLYALIVSICGCSPVRMKNARFSGPSKRTVTFNIHNANQLNGGEKAVANSFLSNHRKYIPKYVEVNYDSVNNLVNSLYSKLNYWNKTKYTFSRKIRYRLYASATGTDHLLDLEIHITNDTTRTAIESERLWDQLWENNNSFTKELVEANEAHYIRETYKIKKINYKLRYIDGHTGKTMWSMSCRWPAGLFGFNKKSPDMLIKNKFEKKFPFKLAD